MKLSRNDEILFSWFKHEEDIEKWTFDKTDEEEEGGQQTRACVVIWIFCEFQTEDTQAASSKQQAASKLLSWASATDLEEEERLLELEE